MLARAWGGAGGSVLWLSLGLMGAGVSVIFHREWWFPALLAGTVCIGMGWYTLRIVEPLPESLAARLPSHGVQTQGEIITLRGMALSAAKPVPRAKQGLARFVITSPKSRFEFASREILLEDGAWSPVRGNVWVAVTGEDEIPLRAGERVEITGRFSGIDPPGNPGEDDIRLLAAERGFVGSLSLSGPALIRSAPPTDGGVLDRAYAAWLGFSGALQTRARDVVSRAAGDDERAKSLLLGLMLGDFDPTQRDAYDAFARQGLVHILSISGFHLSVMAGLALLLIRLTGDRGWIEPTVVAALVLVYMCIVPPSSPVMRSGVMVFVLLLSEAAGRRYDHVTILTWIALGLVIWRPCDLWSLGYQLSLGNTAALFALAGGLRRGIFGEPLRGTLRFREHRWRGWLSGVFQECVAANVLCWTLSLPVLICRIGWISPLAMVVSAVVTPLIMVTLWVGYIALLVGMAVPAAADLASGVLGHLARWSLEAVVWVDALAFSSLHVPSPSGVWAACATIALILAFKFGVRRADAPARSAAILGTIGLCGIWLVAEWSVWTRLPASVAMRVDMLDVSNGSCLLVRSGREALLWDCGTLSATGVETRVIDAARALHINQTPTVVVTHPDIDHFGGILDVARPLGVKLVLMPRRFFDDAAKKPRGAAAFALAELSRRGIEVKQIAEGDGLHLGSITLTFLSPPVDADWEKDNNHSLVGLWKSSAGEELLVTTGDIEDDAIERLAERYPNLHPIVMELPHHGSAHERSIEWVGSIAPRVVLQSTGIQRANDPRWAKVREGRTWYTTALGGAAWVEVYAEGGGVRSGSVRK